LGKLVIGDLGKEYGGPIPERHASHQIGLDVDIWYATLNEAKAKTQNATLPEVAPSAITATGEIDPNIFSASQEHVLKDFSENKKVARIFVNVRIKEKLCKLFVGQKWLAKIRPWYGHMGHFHVRLNCPTGEKFCKRQPPPPAGDGCGDGLLTWYARETIAKTKTPRKITMTWMDLPPQCSRRTVARRANSRP